MKNLSVSILLLLLSSILLTSCELVGDIFGAGVSTGIFLVIVVIIIILFGASRIFKRRN